MFPKPSYFIPDLIMKSMFIIFIMKTVDRLSCPREDIGSYRYLARGFWRAKSKISTVLCSIPGAFGTFIKFFAFRCSYKIFQLHLRLQTGGHTVLKGGLCHFSFGHNSYYLTGYMGFYFFSIDGYNHNIFINLFKFNFCLSIPFVL